MLIAFRFDPKGNSHFYVRSVRFKPYTLHWHQGDRTGISSHTAKTKRVVVVD